MWTFKRSALFFVVTTETKVGIHFHKLDVTYLAEQLAAMRAAERIPFHFSLYVMNR